MRAVSVIIITRNRAPLLNDCLRHVLAQDHPPLEIVVADASDDDATEKICAINPVRYLHLRDAANQIPRARNAGLRIARGEIIAYIDDDSLVQPGWLRALVESYADARVGGVGGIVLAPNETPQRDGAVGEISRTGNLIGNFNVACDQPREVKHLRGCNMSFRRRALESIRGFDTRYDGANVREETDVCVAIRRAGWRVLYESRARVIHLYARKENFSRDDARDHTLRYSIAKNHTYFRLKHFFSPLTLLAIFLGGTLFALFDSLRRTGARGFALTWSDWRGRAAGTRAFLQSRFEK